ncbi:hypothetical protein [Nocardioides speluncae]|uniref:hypothetical protein n=1 Tax=Nocardioides speluncae TaxID=2670337 RepID=UPI000D69E1B6|nr:hypothetical protein [Nocardioides speluncae]
MYTLSARRVASYAAIVVGITTALQLGHLAAADRSLYPGGPSKAACQHESGPLGPVTPLCDDRTPPNTKITRVRPRPDHGWLRTSQVRYEFRSVVNDGDTDPMAFECRFDGPAKSHGWRPCTSPQVYDELPDSASRYTFRVRAYDAADRAFIYPNPVAPNDVDDTDASPAKSAVRIDTTTPDTTLSGLPRDPVTPGFPVLLSKRLTLHLSASEPAVRWECRQAGEAAPCAGGDLDLGPLAPGTHTFWARATDRAGNVDPTPRDVHWTVPYNQFGTPEQREAHWAEVPADGHFGRDYLQATANGATLSRRFESFSEIRLIVPKGPALGTVQVRIDGVDYGDPISLEAPEASLLNVIVVRSGSLPTTSGKVSLVVVSHDKPVRIDGVVVR